MDLVSGWLEVLFGQGDSDHALWLAAVRLDILLFVGCAAALLIAAIAGRRGAARRWDATDLIVAGALTAAGALLRIAVTANIADFGGIGYSRILVGYKGHFAAAQLYSLIYEQTARDLEHAILLNRIAGILSVPLLYALCRRLLPDGRGFAVCATALLALHPLHAMFGATDALPTCTTLVAVSSYLMLAMAFDGGRTPAWRLTVAGLGAGAGLALVTQVRYENLLLLAPPALFVLARRRSNLRPLLPGAIAGGLFMTAYFTQASRAGSSFQNPILWQDIVLGARHQLFGNPIFAMLPALIGIAAATFSRRSRVRLLAPLPLLAVLPLAAVVSPEGHHLARTYLNLLLPLILVSGYGLALLWSSPRRGARALVVACLVWAALLPIAYWPNLRARHIEMAEHEFFRRAVAALPPGIDRIIVPDDERLGRQTGSTIEVMTKYRAIAASVRPDVDVVGTTRFFEQARSVDCSRDNCAFFRALPCFGLRHYWFADPECAAMGARSGAAIAEEEVIAGSFVECSVYRGETWRERCAPVRLLQRFGLYRLDD